MNTVQTKDIIPAELEPLAWDQLTEGQKDCLNLFAKGRYLWGDEEMPIKTVTDLVKANEWAMNRFRRDYRFSLVGQIQMNIIVPIIQHWACKIVRGAS